MLRRTRESDRTISLVLLSLALEACGGDEISRPASSLEGDACATGGMGEIACDVAHGGACATEDSDYVCTTCPPGSSVSIDQLSCIAPSYGTPFTLTTSTTAPNGAWSWFEDERAIIDAHDPANPVLLVSSVSSAVDGDQESGDIDLLWRNLATGTQGEFELHNRLERDDHDSAALYIRPDGRYLAMYSRHIGDNFTRWRVSTNPHDPTAWDAAQTLDVGAGTTYDNVHFLPGDNGGAGRLYNFTRATGFDPVIETSSDHGSTWSVTGRLLTYGTADDRPYVRYASNGKRIHFISTEEHPRDFPNSVYHGYVQDGVLYDSHGTVIDSNVLDANGMSPTLLTPVFRNGSVFGGTTMNRAWTINLELDNTGNPAAIFSARANDADSDHRFFYARFDGDEWHVHELARAGGFLYASENDYTGLVSIDPENPNVVYMSAKIDPRTSSTTTKYELYRGVTTDFGATFAWTPITTGSTVDNLRPVVPSWNGHESTLLWMQGTYTSYTSWDTEIVGVRFVDTGRKSLLWTGTAANADAWDLGTSNNWDSGRGTVDVYHQGDEVAFDDTGATHTVDLTGVIAPMGVAFNNTTVAYTITGAGIGGTGDLRVIGGGAVTLSNDANVYTGDTLVYRGSLVLQDDATVASSPRIHVGTNGVLDVSGLAGGALALDGQLLTVDGDVTGDVTATDGAEIIVGDAGALADDVWLGGSTLAGEGHVGGNLSTSAGAIVRVGGDGITVQTAMGSSVYHDATSGVSGNTTLANGSTFGPPLDGTTGVDNNWEQRTVLGSSGNIFEAGGEVAEDAPTIRTTVGSLVPGRDYEVSVLFWDATPAVSVEDWNIRAGFQSTGLTLFATAIDAPDLGATAGVSASTLPYTTAPTIFTESNRTLIAGLVGRTTANASGQLAVYIDDRPASIAANNRTWYDGLAVRELVPVAGVHTLSVGGDHVQVTGTTLELDIFSPAILDRLVVTGTFSAAGRLSVSLAAGAPEPALGDAFQILEVGAWRGAFDAYDLPVLTNPDLAWDVSRLSTTGELIVGWAVPRAGQWPPPAEADLQRFVEITSPVSTAWRWTSKPAD